MGGPRVPDKEVKWRRAALVLGPLSSFCLA